MKLSYRPGIWARKYRHLPQRERDRINKLTNGIFATATGVTRKLDPRRDRGLCDRWLMIRDEVMAGKHGSTGNSSVGNRVNNLANSIGEFAMSAADIAYSSLNSPATPWMRIAHAEHNRGVKEIPGAKHNERIMNYIRSCPDLYATENKRKYTEREGEEGVKWCSAFVNWCMKQSGIRGTNSARALSWTTWGVSCEPKPGAVVVTKGSKYRHVAFVESVNGKLKMLGGNQQKAGGGGAYNQVSLSSINKKIVVAYRWPKR